MERFYFFNYATNQLDLMGEFPDWKAAYATVVDKTSGIVFSEERWRLMARDTRFPGGLKMQNARTKQNYRIIETEDGGLSTEGPFPSPPPEPPRKWRGD